MKISDPKISSVRSDISASASYFLYKGMIIFLMEYIKAKPKQIHTY